MHSQATVVQSEFHVVTSCITDGGRGSRIAQMECKPGHNQYNIIL